MERLTPLALALAVGALSLTSVGCAALGIGGGGTGGGGKKLYGNNTMNEARDNRDMKTLSDMCMLKVKTQGSQVRRDACESAVEFMIEDKDFATLSSICKGLIPGQTPEPGYEKWQYRSKACEAVRLRKGSAETEELAQASCANIEQRYKAAATNLATMSMTDKKGASKVFLAAGKKAAECGKWDFIINEMAHHGNDSKGMGYALITTLGADGTDWVKQFWAYVKRKGSAPAFSGKQGQYFLIHYATFLIKSGKTDKCESYIPVAAKLEDMVFGPLNYFFRETNCKKAASTVAKRLSSDRYKTRMFACKTLGKIGLKKYRKKLAKLGKSDPYFHLRTKDDRGNLYLKPIKIYSVRNECAKQANK